MMGYQPPGASMAPPPNFSHPPAPSIYTPPMPVSGVPPAPGVHVPQTQTPIQTTAVPPPAPVASNIAAHTGAARLLGNKNPIVFSDDLLAGSAEVAKPQNKSPHEDRGKFFPASPEGEIINASSSSSSVL
jgi:hypothetical protein